MRVWLSEKLTNYGDPIWRERAYLLKDNNSQESLPQTFGVLKTFGRGWCWGCRGGGCTPLRDGCVAEPESVGGQQGVGRASQRCGKVAEMCPCASGTGFISPRIERQD